MAGFWNSPTAPEAKRVYRWIVSLGVSPNNMEPFLAKKVTQPSYTMTETKHNFLNHTFFYPGRIEWQTVDITFVDPSNPDSGAKLLNLLQASGYELPEDATDRFTLSKAKSIKALGIVSIEMIDADGLAVSAWQLINGFLKDLKFSELSYEADDMVEITATIRYDYAKYGVMGKGFGASPWKGVGAS